MHDSMTLPLPYVAARVYPARPSSWRAQSSVVPRFRGQTGFVKLLFMEHGWSSQGWIPGSSQTKRLNATPVIVNPSHDRPLRVIIDAQQGANSWVLSVSDNGIGFPPEASERVFELFTQVHRDRAEGDGLGLALCRRIVHHHRGWIRASSDPGHGTTFEFSLREPKEA